MARTLAGAGAFRVPYAPPLPQGPQDTFFIPEGQVHAFGPAEGADAPVLVTVMWTPPFHSNYTVPVPQSRCRTA